MDQECAAYANRRDGKVRFVVAIPAVVEIFARLHFVAPCRWTPSRALRLFALSTLAAAIAAARPRTHHRPAFQAHISGPHILY
jgi:hypothetical protein